MEEQKEYIVSGYDYYNDHVMYIIKAESEELAELMALERCDISRVVNVQIYREGMYAGS